MRRSQANSPGRGRRGQNHSRGTARNVPTVTTLPALVEAINAEARYCLELSEAGARSIASCVKLLLDPLMIRVNIDLSGVTKPQEIRQSIINDTVVLDFDPDEVPRRFCCLLSVQRHKANFNYPLVRQANGLILEIVEEIAPASVDGAPVKRAIRCKPLAVPASDFNPQYSEHQLAAMVDRGDYYCYPLKDGTSVTLYYDAHYIGETTRPMPLEGQAEEGVELGAPRGTVREYSRGRWLFGSRNGFSIDNLVWRGFRFGQVIADVLRRYPEFSTERLDRKLTYTFGFKHPAYHPFAQPAEWREEHFTTPGDEAWEIAAWAVQSQLTADPAAPRDLRPDIGLPLQEPLADMPGSTSTAATFADMRERCLLAIKTYRDTKSIFLGYLLRAKDAAKAGAYSDLMLESNLWQEIRHLIYQQPPLDKADQQLRRRQEQNFKNFHYILLDSFMNFERRQSFLTYFPQFGPEFERFSAIFQAAAAYIHSQAVTSETARVAPTKPAPGTTDETIGAQIGALMLEIIIADYQVGKTGAKRDKTRSGSYRATADLRAINTLLLSSAYTERYFNLIYPDG